MVVPRMIVRERMIRVLAVGRLVEKKGFTVLVAAMARLDNRFTLRIVGDGPDRAALEAQIVELGLSSRVQLCGPATHHAPAVPIPCFSHFSSSFEV